MSCVFADFLMLTLHNVWIWHGGIEPKVATFYVFSCLSWKDKEKERENFEIVCQALSYLKFRIAAGVAKENMRNNNVR